jgi:hypothetical protein
MSLQPSHRAIRSVGGQHRRKQNDVPLLALELVGGADGYAVGRRAEGGVQAVADEVSLGGERSDDAESARLDGVFKDPGNYRLCAVQEPVG